MDRIYDDPAFFEKYSDMPRSRLGLEGAGEWHVFRNFMPDFSNKDVLDLGCGFGWHARYAAERKARHVVAIDVSERMLAKAESMDSEGIEYRLSAMEDLSFPASTFDVIISSLAFHYVKDWDTLIRKISSWLRPDGDFVFSVEHPVFTAYGSQDWYYSEDGKILHFPVDNYFYEGKRDAIFLGEHMTKYHRTLTTYISSLLDNGFTITKLAEPEPPENMMDIPGMKDEMRRPMMLLIAAKKTR